MVTHMDDKMASPQVEGGELSLSGFIVRFIAALALVLLTYNPSGYSFFHWFHAAFSSGGLEALHFFVAAVLAVGWAILLVATNRSLGLIGLVLGIVLLGTLIWLLADLGVLDADTWSAKAWVALVCLALLLAIGLSWSHIWRRLTGQYETDGGDD